MIGTIRLGNKRSFSDHKPEIDDVVIDIDRTTIFGNQFPIDESTCRSTSLLAFKVDLELEMQRREGSRYDAICQIAETVRNGQDVILMCWCHPLPCHGDFIKTAVESMVR